VFIILVLLFLGLLYFIYKNRAIAPSEPAKDIEAAVVAEAAPAKVEEVAPVVDGIDELEPSPEPIAAEAAYEADGDPSCGCFNPAPAEG
jgi:hypothetical protein